MLLGSRFTSKVESRFEPTEDEVLVVVETLNTDLSMTSLIPDYIALKEKTLKYRFMMMLVPGVKHKIPDNLSRCPVCCDGPNHRINDADVKVSAFAFTTAHNDQVVKWDRAKVYSVHWGIKPSHSKHPPSFFAKPPASNLQTVQTPSF